MAAYVQITKNNFESLILKSEKPVLLDFWATWCGPCQMIAPTIEKIAEENPQYLVGKVNVDEESELAEAFRIEAIPTLIAMKNGSVTGQLCGAYPKEQILALLKK